MHGPKALIFPVSSGRQEQEVGSLVLLEARVHASWVKEEGQRKKKKKKGLQVTTGTLNVQAETVEEQKYLRCTPYNKSIDGSSCWWCTAGRTTTKLGGGSTPSIHPGLRQKYRNTPKDAALKPWCPSDMKEIMRRLVVSDHVTMTREPRLRDVSVQLKQGRSKARGQEEVSISAVQPRQEY